MQENTILINYFERYPKIILVLSLVCIILIFSLSFIAFYNNGDDYSFLNNIRKNGVLGNSIKGYLLWDGRFLTIPAIFQQFILQYVKVEITVFIWSFCFIVSGSLLIKILELEFEISAITFVKKCFIALFFTIVFWLGSLTHFSQTIYWVIGGVYSLNLLIGTIWIIYFLKSQKNKISKNQKFLFLLISILVGASTVNLSIGLITLVIVTIWIDFLSNKKVLNIFNFYLLGFLIIGLLFILFAPGNFIRAEQVNSISINSNLNVNVFQNFFEVLFRYLKWSSILILLAIISSFSFLALEAKEYEFTILKAMKNDFKIVNFLQKIKWLLVALSTISPFITMPSLASKRTVIYFMYFIFIFILLSFLNLSKSISEENENSLTLKISNKASFFLTIFVLFATIFFSAYNFKKGVVLKDFISQRDSLLKNSKGKVVFLKKINPKLNSFCYELIDYKASTDENSNWIIEGLEDYYQVKKIIIE